MTTRCKWADKSERVSRYHDTEWGVPVYEDQALFQALSLEVFQAGLTWSLILQRRESLIRGLAEFDVDQLAGFSEAQQRDFLNDETMIRNPRKLKAVVYNARQWQQQQLTDVSPAEQIWQCCEEQGAEGLYNQDASAKNTFIEQTTLLFKSWGLIGVGSKTTLSFLQATGFINDHEATCFRRKEIYLSVHTTGRISQNMRE